MEVGDLFRIHQFARFSGGESIVTDEVLSLSLSLTFTHSCSYREFYDSKDSALRVVVVIQPRCYSPGFLEV